MYTLIWQPQNITVTGMSTILPQCPVKAINPAYLFLLCTLYPLDAKSFIIWNVSSTWQEMCFITSVKWAYFFDMYLSLTVWLTANLWTGGAIMYWHFFTKFIVASPSFKQCIVSCDILGQVVNFKKKNQIQGCCFIVFFTVVVFVIVFFTIL